MQYAPDKSAFVWKIKQLGGSREFLMRAHFGLPSVKSGVLNSKISLYLTNHYRFPEQDAEKRAPITVKFEIPYFTVSGIQVRYLKIVEKSGYQALPWVRYITQNGDDYRYGLFHDPYRDLTFPSVCGRLWRKEMLQSCRCRSITCNSLPNYHFSEHKFRVLWYSVTNIQRLYLYSPLGCQKFRPPTYYT